MSRPDVQAGCPGRMSKRSASTQRRGEASPMSVVRSQSSPQSSPQSTPRSTPRSTPQSSPPDRPRSRGRRRMGQRNRIAGLTVAALTLVAVAFAGNAASAETATPATAAAVGPADLGSNVKVFDPSMPVAQIQQQVDAIYRATGQRRDGYEPLRPALQTRHLRHRGEPAEHPGRLLHRGCRPGPEPDRRHHQRPGRRLQPLPHRLRAAAALLRRPEQLLAIAVQPDHQRGRRVRRLPSHRPCSGRPRSPRRCAG